MDEGRRAVIEAAVGAVPGVSSATVEPDPDDPEALGLLRLDLAPGAHEDDVAAGVAAVLRDGFGLDVDAAALVEDAVPERRLSVVRPGDARPHGHRLVISHLQLVRPDTGVSATVTLAMGRAEHQGVSRGERDVPASVAAATCAAVEAAVSGAVRLRSLAVVSGPVGAGRVVVSQVLLDGPDGPQRLTGAAEVRTEEGLAVVRATLDAVNRRLEPLLEGR